MSWRKMMLAGGAVLGAAAAYNRVATRRVRAGENDGGENEWFDWLGRAIAYTRRGSGAPILLVHAIHAAASSHEWQSNVDALADVGTVYTIDLLGFGRSERPAVRYSAASYLHLLDDFARTVIGEPCVLVANSLSGAFAAALGAQDPERYPALVLVEPAGISSLSEPGDMGGEAARVVGDTRVVGTALFNLSVSHSRLRRWLERAYAARARITDGLVRQYYATSHQPGARFAPAAFASRQLNIDVREAVRQLSQPTLLVWGARARLAPPGEARAFLALNRHLELAILDDAGDLPHAEQPAKFNHLLADFISRASVEVPAGLA